MPEDDLMQQMQDMVRASCEYRIEQITPQWLAGFFDGEGCCSVQRANRTGLYGLVVNVSQKDWRLIQRIAELFPGTASQKNHVKPLQFCGSGVSKICWTNHSARPFLEYIKDYVVLKRAQVQYALLFLDHVLPETTKFQTLNPTSRVMRECLGQLIITANRDKAVRYDSELQKKAEVK